MNRGYVHIYSGNGKGKTTAAVGLAMRAAGQDQKVYIGQFMKGQFYGELKTIAQIDNIDVEQFGRPDCIRRSEVTQVHRDMAENGLQICQKKIISGNYDLVVLDEICVAIWFRLIREDKVIEMIVEKPVKTELVLTGRKASNRLIERADLVTRMNDIKHYYKTEGTTARPGIEY
jgi:cob(I)alamin adenosyltransferase